MPLSNPIPAFPGQITDTQHGSRTGGGMHSAVTIQAPGFMTPTDKAKLDGLTVPTATALAAYGPPVPDGTKVYWGAWVDHASTGTTGDIPWDNTTRIAFEAANYAGRTMKIEHWGQRWRASGSLTYQSFFPNDSNQAWSRGAFPMIDWSPWDITLDDILAGTHDTYIKSWATAVKNWGNPLFIRPMHEMNAVWAPSQTSWTWQSGSGGAAAANGNTPAKFILAWQHMVNLFRDPTVGVGCTNAAFVWCPNRYGTDEPTITDASSFWPGASYVDWTGMDCYNPGASSWRDVGTTFQQTYNKIVAISGAANKPMVIGEFGCSSNVTGAPGGSTKAAWLTQFFGSAGAAGYVEAANMPQLRAVVYFNKNMGGNSDWPLNVGTGAQVAAAAGLARAFWLDKDDTIPAAVTNPGSVAFTDVAQAYSQTQTFNGAILANGTLTQTDRYSILDLVDDFTSGNSSTGGVGSLGWTPNAGATTTVTTPDANHPGIINRSTGTSAATLTSLYPGFTSATGDILGTGTFDVTFLVRLAQTDTDTQVRIGVSSNPASSAPTDAAYYEKLYADTNWFCVNRAASVQATRLNSSVAANTNWLAVRVRRIDASTIGFRMATSLVLLATATEQTVAADTPQAAVMPFVSIINQTTTAKSIDIDYARIIVSGLSR